MLLRQVIALSKASGGTTCVTKAELAGMLNACALPMTIRQP